MKTRLKDIAEDLNLSPALVSGVLNNNPRTWASDETRKRIHESAKRLNYQPSAAARALSRGKAHSVAFVYRRLEGLDYRLAYTGLVDVFSEELQSTGNDLLVSNFATQDEVLEHLEKLARSRSCDAFILWGREQDTEPQGQLLESLGMPFLIKGRHEETHPHWYQVDFDHEWMTGNAVDHLYTQGRRKLAYLGFPHEDNFVKALRSGFLEANQTIYGTRPESALICEAHDVPEKYEPTISAWLRLPEGERPDGFVIGAGNAAWLALETCCAQLGLHVGPEPETIGATGIASHSFTLMFGTAEVYLGIEIDRLARMASPALIKALPDLPEGPTVFRFRPELAPAPTLTLLKRGVIFAPRSDRPTDFLEPSSHHLSEPPPT